MRELLARARENLRESGSLVPVLFVEGRESALVAFQQLALCDRSKTVARVK